MAVNTTYGKGILPENLTYDENSTYKMVEKIARQVIKTVITEDRLATFDKIPINDGTTIEEAVVGLATASAYDKDAVDVFVKTNPNMYVRYYKNWTSTQFATTAQINEIRKVMLSGGESAESLAEKIAGVLAQSDKQDKYERLRDLFKWASENQAMVNAGTKAFDDYKGILKLLKDTISGMTFVNTDYNVAQVKRKTFMDDIIILMPYDIKNAIDVDELAGVFNLDKAEIRNRIIEIDTKGKIYIVDRQAILAYTRLYEMTSQWNPKGLYMNYWLTADRLYAISPLFDACYITLSAETGANAQKVVVTNTTENPVNTKEVTG